jgi:hypothetical protein
MNLLSTPNQRTQQLREMLYQLPVTHIATLNIQPLYRNSNDLPQVFQQFVRKFNRSLWGGKGYNSGKRIGVVGFVHARRHFDDAHVHMGLWALPERKDDEELKKRFKQQAKHTSGVLYAETQGPRRGNLAVDFQRENTGGWIAYCTRHLADSSDPNCLIELLHTDSTFRFRSN